MEQEVVQGFMKPTAHALVTYFFIKASSANGVLEMPIHHSLPVSNPLLSG